VTFDDGRARLPGRLEPGQETSIALTVHAPSSPGRYTLQVDVVQEGVAWFAPTGAPALEIEARVGRASKWRPGRGGQPVKGYEGGTFEDLISPTSMVAPMFDMNGIPRDEVEHILAAHGATLLGTDEWVNEWISFTYYVQAGDRRRAEPPIA
jgi:hypothetical protein